jgi:hypothetical protein
MHRTIAEALLAIGLLLEEVHRGRQFSIQFVKLNVSKGLGFRADF